MIQIILTDGRRYALDPRGDVDWQIEPSGVMFLRVGTEARWYAPDQWREVRTSG